MNKKIAFLLIAIVGIGLYALPSTVALFSGQHDFKNIDATGNQIECTKCHGDVQAEMVSTVGVKTGTDKPHAAFKCEYCHRIEAGAATGDNAYAAITYTVDTDLNGKGNDRSATNLPMRTLVISMVDFEEENFPGSPKYPNEGIKNDVLDKALAQPAGVRPTKGYALSPRIAGTEADTTVLKLYNEYERPTYNSAAVGGAAPFDQNAASKNRGLDLSKIPQLAGTDLTVNGWYGTGTGGVVLAAPTPTGRSWTTSLLNAGSKTVTPGTEYHAASLVSCLECHGGFEPAGHYSRVVDDELTFAGGNDDKCGICHYGYTNRVITLAAGGFGITNAIDSADTGAQEAHMEFQKTDDTLTQYKAVGTASYSNGACIACHTHTDVDIEYTKPNTLSFNVDMTVDSIEDLTGFSADGHTVSQSDNVPAPVKVD